MKKCVGTSKKKKPPFIRMDKRYYCAHSGYHSIKHFTNSNFPIVNNHKQCHARRGRGEGAFVTLCMSPVSQYVILK